MQTSAPWLRFSPHTTRPTDHFTYSKPDTPTATRRRGPACGGLCLCVCTLACVPCILCRTLYCWDCRFDRFDSKTPKRIQPLAVCRCVVGGLLEAQLAFVTRPAPPVYIWYIQAYRFIHARCTHTGTYIHTHCNNKTSDGRGDTQAGGREFKG